MPYLGDYAEDYATLNYKFTTRDSTGLPTNPVDLAVKVYTGSATGTEIDTGVTLAATGAFDGIAGLNNLLIDLSAAAFYAVGADYAVVVTAGTVDGVSIIGEVICTFSIENRMQEVDVTKISGDATAANNLEAILDGSGVTADVDITMRSLTITNDTAAAVVLTGTTAGLLCQGSAGHGIVAQALAGNSAGLYCIGFDAGPGIDVMGGDTGHGLRSLGGTTSGDGIYAFGQTLGHGMTLVGAGASKYDLNADMTGNITGNLSGSAGSVIGAVGSVTGAVGSVTGHTAQTGDSFAIVNGAHGLVSIQDDIDVLMGGGGATSDTITITDEVASPLDGAGVWINSDLAGADSGTTVAGVKYTNSSGLVTFQLDDGTYWVHAELSGYDFTTTYPRQMTVSGGAFAWA